MQGLLYSVAAAERTQVVDGMEGFLSAARLEVPMRKDCSLESGESHVNSVISIFFLFWAEPEPFFKQTSWFIQVYENPVVPLALELDVFKNPGPKIHLSN